MKIKRYLARTFLNYTTAQLWSLVTGRMVLKFDDGEEKEISFMDLLQSSYGWEYHRRFKNTPLLSKHLASFVIKDGRLGPGTHLKQLGNCINSAHDAYITDRNQRMVTLDNGSQMEIEDFKDALCLMETEATNEIYNDYVTRLGEFAMSVDPVEAFQLMHHPQIEQANNALPYLYKSLEEKIQERQFLMKEGQKLINHAHKVVHDVMWHDPIGKLNPISELVRSGLINESQTLQCLSARGYLTDINSDLFTHPILVGYMHGMRSAHDTLIESRSASKSLIFTKDPLRAAEYFSRRLQLVSFNVQNLHHGDCGSTEYMHVAMRDVQLDGDGKVATKSDLETFEGKLYMDDDGTLKPITPGDKSLLGRMLKLRTVRKCCHPDPVGVCSTCVGEMATFIPRGTNIGHAACVTLASKSSQNVMSVKHNDGNADVESISLSPHYRAFFKISMDGNSYMLEPKIQAVKPKLVIPVAKVNNLSDIFLPKSVEELNIARVTQLTDIALLTYPGGPDQVPEITPMMVALGNRLASFTHPMLDYIKTHGWTIDVKGNYVVDLEHWDYQNAIMSLPMKHANMSDHSKELADMLESTVTELRARDKEVNPSAFMLEFHDLVNKKLSVNFAVNEIVVYGAMIVSAEENNYGLPKPWTKEGLGVKDVTMMMRSLSAEMAHESHYQVLYNPASYIHTNRMPHPFDGLLMPFEMYQHRYGLAPKLERNQQAF